MKIYVLNNSGYGLDIINSLKKKIKLTGIIGLNKNRFSKKVENFVNQKKFCEDFNLKYIDVKSYKFSEKDLSNIKKKQIDILLVLGWQRLIPKELIEHVRYNVVGLHGSPFKINFGRGRSPQNWTIILGYKKFYLSIFKIDPGIDSGDVIGTSKFKVSTYDDISTSYLKTAIVGADLLIDFLKNKKMCKAKSFKKQKNNIAKYLPQREPNDGMIDWNRSAIEIYDFVRALAKPYPCAFTILKKEKIKIIKCIPFEINIKKNNYKPGTIIKIFNNKDVLVKAKKDYILIQNYNINKIILSEGDIFKSTSYKKQINLIIKRHKKINKLNLVNENLTYDIRKIR